MVYSDAWGKLIHEKNHKSKISWHCPINRPIWLAQLHTKMALHSIRQYFMKKFDYKAILAHEKYIIFSHYSISLLR
jgi:hypothetical protein